MTPIETILAVFVGVLLRDAVTGAIRHIKDARDWKAFQESNQRVWEAIGKRAMQDSGEAQPPEESEKSAPTPEMPPPPVIPAPAAAHTRSDLVRLQDSDGKLIGWARHGSKFHAKHCGE